MPEPLKLHSEPTRARAPRAPAPGAWSHCRASADFPLEGCVNPGFLVAERITFNLCGVYKYMVMYIRIMMKRLNCCWLGHSASRGLACLEYGV